MAKNWIYRGAYNITLFNAAENIALFNFRPIDRATPFLLPPSVEDGLPKNHLVRFVVDIVDQLDLSALSRQYRGTGSAAYHPAGMLGLLIYGYATGVYSSRRTGRDGHHPHWEDRYTEPPPLNEPASAVNRMKHRLKTRQGRKLYGLRKQTVEPVFGIIKSVMRFWQFLLRGLAAVQGEWTLVTMAWNIKRMAVLAG